MRVFGLLPLAPLPPERAWGPRSGSPEGKCLLPARRVLLQGHSLSHPLLVPAALALRCLLVLRLQRNPNPCCLFPEDPLLFAL